VQHSPPRAEPNSDVNKPGWLARLEVWKPLFDVLTAIAAVVSLIGLAAGVCISAVAYRHQVQADMAKERHDSFVTAFDLKKAVYFDLVDAGSAVANSTSKDEAEKAAAHYYTIYFGRAHALTVDRAVWDAKVAYGDEIDKAIERGVFPSAVLQEKVQDLDRAVREAMHVNEVFPENTYPVAASAPTKAH
jgi:hypothetical protein